MATQVSPIDMVRTAQHLLNELNELVFCKSGVPYIRIESVALPLKAIEKELERCHRVALNVMGLPLPSDLQNGSPDDTDV